MFLIVNYTILVSSQGPFTVHYILSDSDYNSNNKNIEGVYRGSDPCHINTIIESQLTCSLTHLPAYRLVCIIKNFQDFLLPRFSIDVLTPWYKFMKFYMKYRSDLLDNIDFQRLNPLSYFLKLHSCLNLSQCEVFKVFFHTKFERLSFVSKVTQYILSCIVS